jgi:FMN phosphatase YigB (HAD superfamily)
VARLLPAAVFFDAYGTLIHYPEKPSPFDYMANAMDRLGWTIPRVWLDDALRAEMAYYKEHFSSVRSEADLKQLRTSDAKVYMDALGNWAGGDPDIEALATELALAFQTRVLADADSAIDVVRRAGVRTGVLSNFAYMLPLVLAEVGLTDVLDPIVVSASVGYEKPDPRIFAAAAAAVGADVCDCVLIGDDRTNDVEGAQTSGMPVVWLRRDRCSLSVSPTDVATALSLDEAAHMAVGKEWRTLSRPR